MLYQDGDALFGFDMRTMLAQPATLEARQPLHGVRAHPDSSYIAFADDSGLRNLEISSGNTGLFFSNRQGGHFLPREWGGSGHLVVQQVNSDGSLEWGWTSLEETSWQPLALKNGFSCDTGIN